MGPCVDVSSACFCCTFRFVLNLYALVEWCCVEAVVAGDFTLQVHAKSALTLFCRVMRAALFLIALCCIRIGAKATISRSAIY